MGGDESLFLFRWWIVVPRVEGEAPGGQSKTRAPGLCLIWSELFYSEPQFIHLINRGDVAFISGCWQRITGG